MIDGTVIVSLSVLGTKRITVTGMGKWSWKYRYETQLDIKPVY